MNCTLGQKQKTSLYSWSSEVFGVSKAGAQGVENKIQNLPKNTQQNIKSNMQNNITNNISSSLPFPVAVIVLFFIVFMFILSIVYVYHWVNFNMGDKFIKNAIYIYFAGLIVLSMPLILFLI